MVEDTIGIQFQCQIYTNGGHLQFEWLKATQHPQLNKRCDILISYVVLKSCKFFLNNVPKIRSS